MIKMNVIETKDVSYKYPDGTLALEKVNFQAPKGKIIALLGSKWSWEIYTLLTF